MRRVSAVTSIRVAVGVALLVVWQWGAKLPVVGKWAIFDAFVISTPTQILAGLAKLIERKQFLVHVGYTLGATAAAIVLGIATGVLAAVVLFNVPLLRRLADPFMHFFNTLPRVVLAPFLLIALGVGIAPRIVMAWSFVFFLVFFNVLYGLSRLREAHRRHIRVLGGRRIDEIVSLQWPIALAWTVRAFPQAVAYGFVGTVFQEFVGGNSGIGSVMIFGLNELNAATVMGTVVVLAALGAVLVAAGNWVGRRFAPWRRELGV